jgi:hypothetical protein
VEHAYAGKIRTTKNDYVEGGHYLDYLPSDAAGRGFAMRFNTDGKSAVEIYTGQSGAVANEEGA